MTGVRLVLKELQPSDVVHGCRSKDGRCGIFGWKRRLRVDWKRRCEGSKAGETNSDVNIIPRETRPRPTETARIEPGDRAAAGSWGCVLRMEKTWEMYECSEMTTGQETPQMVAAGSKEQHTGKFG
ncbi:hypothetical protein DFH09DRAFT_1086898 [Mycena vulgaris]|nr:hypothetical protein DFH09DRAFT_1086898 [Mycena vulgaris]